MGGAFDQGHRHYAKPMATVIRVMLHDTDSSASVLEQLQLKSRLRFADTADHINPRNLLATPGLVVMKATAGDCGSYEAPLGNLAPPRMHPPLPFDDWWLMVVTKDAAGQEFRRKDFVQSVANKEGGAHVSETLTEKYAALTRNNSLGFMYAERSGDHEKMSSFEGNVALPSVRQIAYELEITLDHQLDDLL